MPNTYTPTSIQALTTGFQPVSTETTPPESTSEPVMISSAQGAKVVEDTQKRLDAIAPPETGDIPEQKTTEPEVITTPETPKVEVKQDFVTYVDPETGAETTLRGEAINDKTKAELEKKGMIMSASDTSRGDLQEAEMKRKEAEIEVNNAITELSRTAINSKELQQTIRSIKKSYGARIARQNAVNARREKTLNTLGIRLGSRYTGGSGGVFGGILAEEERQGIQRINEIESEMLSAVAGAKKAAKEHNYSVFTKLTELAEKKAEEKTKAFEDLKKAQETAQKTLEEEAKLIENQSAIIEEVQKGTTDPFEIFTALGGNVPFDMIKEMTDTVGVSDKPIVLGSSDLLIDPKTGEVIARGAKVGGVSSGSIGSSLSFGSSSTPVGPATVAGLGATYATSSPEAQMVIDDILNKIPAQLRNTEKETALKMEQIRKQLAAGYTYQQIVDRLSGFSLQGNADKQTGNVLYNLSLGTDIDVGQLASLLNRGAGEQAMTTVENAHLKNVNSFFASADEARQFTSAADKAIALVNDPAFPKNFLGTWDGRQFKAERFLGKDATEPERKMLQQLESQLAFLNAPTRVSIAGTAATASEMEKINAFQANIYDEPETMKIKLEELRDGILNFHNQARSQRGLPTVDKNQLVDNKKRLELYKSLGQMESQAVTGSMNNSDFLSSGAWQGSTPAKDTSATDNKGFFNNL